MAWIFEKIWKEPRGCSRDSGGKKPKQKITPNKQSLRTISLKIQARKKSRGKEKEKD